MSELHSLQPHLLWQWFAQICAIPHPSYHEEELAHHIVQWAKNKNLFVERDSVGNILIRKPATVGMENVPSVALQAHLDMVPQANANTSHNFEIDPIQPYIDGEWVKAKGTTLGADNGIGLASILAVLESDDLIHPEIEALFTMTEESGMEGAIGLQPNWLKSHTLINTDTEENGEIYMGCAGGIDANLTLPLSIENVSFQHYYRVELKGLNGGHSGADIHTGRANAIKTMARFLAHCQQQQANFAFQLTEIQGGSVRNAIPREASATLGFNGSVDTLTTLVTEYEKTLQTELAHCEKNLALTLVKANPSPHALTLNCTQTVINFINALPNGVIRNSDALDNVVETSLSLGVAQTQDHTVRLTILIRSLNESGKQYVTSMLRSLCDMAHAQAVFEGNYPGWEPETHSPIMHLTKTIYDDILGYEARIKVIHAGLECGLLKRTYPNMDMVSIGPTILNAHSPDEKVHIPAVTTYWQLLTRILQSIPQK